MDGLHGGEDLEFAVGDNVGDFDELELDAQVGLVGAVVGHGLLVGHHEEAFAFFSEINVENLLEDAADQVFHDLADFFFLEERRFDINLGEFGLTVGAEVFVAEALDDLVVAVEAGNHQKLLEELRRLRQSEEVAVHRAGRHEVVAGAFGRGLCEERRFDVDEAVFVKEVTEGLSHFEAQLEVALHLLTTQIEHAIGKASRFAHGVVVELEGRRQRRIEDFELLAKHFDAARDEVFVLGAFGASTHNADHGEAELVAHLVGRSEHFGTVRIANHLHETFTVAQVNENHAAVVATTMSPPIEGDGLADEFFVDQATVCGTHNCSGFLFFFVSARVGPCRTTKSTAF